MNYIYDILINFQPNLYDVYDWNKNDDILHLRKIPMFKLHTESLKELCNYNILIANDFLVKIYNRTELFGRNKVAPLEYCFLATDLKEVVGFKLDKMGKIISYSKLLLEEEAEVLEYAQGLTTYELPYQVFEKKELFPFRTREEVKIKNYILKELKQIVKKQDEDKLVYLYLECFGEKCNSTQVVHTIFEKLEQNWDKVYLKLYQFLKMTASKR